MENNPTILNQEEIINELKKANLESQQSVQNSMQPAEHVPNNRLKIIGWGYLILAAMNFILYILCAYTHKCRSNNSIAGLLETYIADLLMIGYVILGFSAGLLVAAKIIAARSSNIAASIFKVLLGIVVGVVVFAVSAVGGLFADMFVGGV